MSFFNRLRETFTHLDNAAHPQAGRPVFAIINTETTGFNKRYDRIIELAAARFDESFRHEGDEQGAINECHDKANNGELKILK